MGDLNLTGQSGALELDPVAIEKMMAACRELADEMSELASLTRIELDRDGYGIGEHVQDLVSAQRLVQHIRAAAVGVDGDTTGSALGLFNAQHAYAERLEAMLNDAMQGYANVDEDTASGVRSVEQ
ncbi:MAG: hypothetical protein GX542_01760 [Rhodococcus sp.]|nr:hypothetical protein [Rhodococcus sp. (in: high G+C Gram-positive bacteria)]